MNLKISNAAGLTAALVGSAVPCLLQAQQAEKPNVLFILADDLGYGDLGCFGNRYIKTDNIDRLATEGVTFTNCYAGASVSSPSRCCLMTGMHTGHTTIRGNMTRTGGIEGIKEDAGVAGVSVTRTSIQPQDTTIANVLSNNGYRTALVNKWHLDGFDPAATPLDRGFDEFYGWLIREYKSHNYYPSIRWDNRNEYVIEENLDGRRADHNTDRSTREAIEFLRRNTDNPFFLYLAYNVPHVPLDSKDLGIYADYPGMSDNDKNYAALITHMDECLGTIFGEMERLGLDKNTIVVFASDNGGAKAAGTSLLDVNGGLRGWKGDLYEGGIRVPMIVRMPDGRSAGQVSDFPCYFPDIFPTLADMTGSYTTVDTDGISILPEVDSPGTMDAEARYLYWEQYPSRGISQAVRWGDWKLIRQNLDRAPELYNLRSDRDETTDVAAGHPDIVFKLLGWITDAHTESEFWPVNVP